VQVIVLNGVSSSGKSTLARELQLTLPGIWLTLGVDTFIGTLSVAMQSSDEGIAFSPDGQVQVGPAFRRLDIAWSLGVAAMIRAGAQIIVDEVWLGGASSQARWKAALEDLKVLWVGVHCSLAVAEARERTRSDRTVGMARTQAALVHLGVTYDLTVDTGVSSPSECARIITERFRSSRRPASPAT
jgi:chloramphenicol 3-O phosphotransferase